MANKFVKRPSRKNKKNSFLHILLLLVIASAIIIFSNIISKETVSVDSKAAINCKRYNKKQCPTNKGCQIVGNRCVSDENQNLTININETCDKDIVVQVMYLGKTKGVDYTAARIATGEYLKASRILSGGKSPPNVKSICKVKFVTCNGITDVGTFCFKFDPKNPITCSQICESSGGKWCKGFSLREQILGCKNVDDLYDNYYFSPLINLAGLSCKSYRKIVIDYEYSVVDVCCATDCKKPTFKQCAYGSNAGLYYPSHSACLRQEKLEDNPRVCQPCEQDGEIIFQGAHG